MLHVRVLEGDGAVYAPGSKAKGLAIQITDETGKPVDGAAVSFRMPEEGPSASFGHGMKTEIVTTTPDGRAAVYGMEANRIPGPFQIRVTAVKGAVRAGIIVPQYVSEHVRASGGTTYLARASSRRKWILLGVAAAGGLGAAVALKGSGGHTAATAAAPASIPQIGIPAISIGKP